jgi:hypothetical protein
MRLSGLGVANFLLAAGILIVGFPSVMAAFSRLPVEATASAVARDAPIGEDEFVRAAPLMERAADFSDADRGDLALALLARSVGEAAPERAARAVHEFRAHLASVPGDSRGWMGLAKAELVLGDKSAATDALKMSILTSPALLWLVLQRCELGIALYGALDAEARELMMGQFRMAAEYAPQSLARLVRRRDATLIALVMLAHDPDALLKFEAELGRI